MNKTIFKNYSEVKNLKISLDIVILKFGYYLSFEILPAKGEELIDRLKLNRKLVMEF